MAERTLANILDDLRETQQAFLDILDRADESLLYQRPADDDWTLAVVLVHIAEARQFFTRETQKVLATPGVQMGRTINHPGRLQNIRDHGNDAPDVIRSNLVTSHADLVNTLEQMTDDDLRIVGQHVKYGSQSLGEFIEHFLVEHDQAHVRQASVLLVGEAKSD